MRIDSLLPPSRSGQPWTALLDGQTLRLPEGVVAEFALYRGKELEEETYLALKERAFAVSLREKAVSLLTGRRLSAGQLQRKLLDKGASLQQAEEITCWAQEIGLINDADYAMALVRYYEAKGYGAYRIKDELYRRQVPREFWEDALAQLEEPDETIDRFLAAKLKDPADRKQVKKASDALVRRGFSWGQVSAGIARFRRRWPEEF